MRRATYLNGILTVNAVLLGALAWSQIAQQPLLASDALAAQTGNDSPFGETGIPNAAQQRQKTLEAIEDLNKNVEAIRQLVAGGNLKVQVSNLDRIQVNVQLPSDARQP
jgi:hypothetical protein